MKENNKKICKCKQSIIDFLKNPKDNGWDKETIVEDYILDVFKENDILSRPEYVDISFILENQEITLKEFSMQLFDKIIDGVCNVITSE